MLMHSVSADSARQLAGLLEGASGICIFTHMHPDGDAVGSSTALLHYLESRGKHATVLLPDPCPEPISFLLPDSGVICVSDAPDAAAAALKGCDLIFGLDFNTPSRTGCAEQMFRDAAVTKVLIDHHLNPDTEAFDLMFSETEVSSASELLYHVLMALPDNGGDVFRLPSDTARAIMAGMTTDTNNFANSVFPSTLRMASALLDRGVDRDELIMLIYNRYRENRVRAMSYLLSERLRLCGNGAAYMILDKATKQRFDLRDGETEGLVNIPLTIGTVRLSILLTEDDGFFRVSIRSKKGTSANMLARESFNGGGHECAAGGRIWFPGDISGPDQAESYVLDMTARFMQKSND